jgi:hypothetical protein
LETSENLEISTQNVIINHSINDLNKKITENEIDIENYSKNNT